MSVCLCPHHAFLGSMALLALLRPCAFRSCQRPLPLTCLTHSNPGRPESCQSGALSRASFAALFNKSCCPRGPPESTFDFPFFPELLASGGGEGSAFVTLHLRSGRSSHACWVPSHEASSPTELSSRWPSATCIVLMSRKERVSVGIGSLGRATTSIRPLGSPGFPLMEQGIPFSHVTAYHLPVYRYLSPLEIIVRVLCNTHKGKTQFVGVGGGSLDFCFCLKSP